MGWSSGGGGEGVPDERGLGLALGVAQVEDQREVAVVDGDARDIDDAGDALLGGVSGGVSSGSSGAGIGGGG